MYELADRACAARWRAVASYSGLPAAVRPADGTVYEGANLEVADFCRPLRVEESTLDAASFGGHRTFEPIAVPGPGLDYRPETGALTDQPLPDP